MGARQSQEVKDAVDYYKAHKAMFTPYGVAKMFGISPSTLYRALQRRKERK